jgi:hypothetical protein
MAAQRAVYYFRVASKIVHAVQRGNPDSILYTPEVVKTPARIQNEILRAREILSNVAKRATRAEGRTRLDALRLRDEAWRAEHRDDRDYRASQLPPLTPTYFQMFDEYETRSRRSPDA